MVNKDEYIKAVRVNNDEREKVGEEEREGNHYPPTCGPLQLFSRGQERLS